MSTYEKIAVLISFLTGLGIFIQLLVMHKAYKADHERRKKQATIEFGTRIRDFSQSKIREIFARYGENVINVEGIEGDKEALREIIELLNFLEELAVGINTQVYDIHIINRMHGSLLVSIYKKCGPIIEDHRKTRGPTIYSEFEQLAREIEDLRRIPKNNKGIIQNS